MKINIFPKLRKQKKNSSQALGINLEIDNSVISINNLPGQLQNKDYDNQDIIFTDLNSDNISEVSSLAKCLKESKDINLHIPTQIEGWLKAIILEEDYSSQLLQDVKPKAYDASKDALIISNEDLTITRKKTSNSMFKEVLDINILSLQTTVFFCELDDFDKEFPLELKDADIVFLSVPLYFKQNEDDETIELLLDIFRKYNVKSVILATETGLLLNLLQSVPIFQEEQKSYPYELNVGKVKCSIFYNKYNNKTKDFIPIAIEDDKNQNRMLLGIYDSMYQYYTAFPEQYDFSSIVLANSSYREVILSYALANLKPNINVFCGEVMHTAMQYFKNYVEKYRDKFDPLFQFYIYSNEHIKQYKVGDFEVVMLPYPEDHSHLVTRIKELSSKEFLVYTETIHNLDFLAKTLKGVQNLVIMIKDNEIELLDKKLDKLKKIQNEYCIERMIIASKDGTEIFCCDDDMD